MLRLHPHQSGFVTNSVNEDILLVENDFKKLAWCGFCFKKLIIEVLHRWPRHLCSNFQSFVYTGTHHAVVQKCLNVWQHDWLIIPIKMFISSLMVLNQQTLGMTEYVHCFQTRDLSVVFFFLYKKQSGYQDQVLRWWWVE